jgi:prolyl oligopeptidase
MSIEGTRSFTLLRMAGLILVAGMARAADPGAPPTAQQGVTGTYHGVEVVDSYRWLENPSSKQVREWSTAQDARTRKYLDALPQRASG